MCLFVFEFCMVLYVRSFGDMALEAILLFWGVPSLYHPKVFGRCGDTGGDVLLCTGKFTKYDGFQKIPWWQTFRIPISYCHFCFLVHSFLLKLPAAFCMNGFRMIWLTIRCLKISGELIIDKSSQRSCAHIQGKLADAGGMCTVCVHLGSQSSRYTMSFFNLWQNQDVMSQRSQQMKPNMGAP